MQMVKIQIPDRAESAQGDDRNVCAAAGSTATLTTSTWCRRRCSAS